MLRIRFLLLHLHLSIQDQKIRKTFHPEDTREGEKAEYIVGGQEGGCWSTEFEDCLPLNRGRRHQTNGAGSIPALGLIPKLASHICYELGSTGIQACRYLLELIQLLIICSFGNPNAQPPTPTQTPTSGQFPSPTAIQTPRNSSSFENRGGWTPTFAEEYSVSNFL